MSPSGADHNRVLSEVYAVLRRAAQRAVTAREQQEAEKEKAR